MTNNEFSDEFDLLVDSYKRLGKYNDQPLPDVLIFDEYEKSVFLTAAQEDFVRMLYSGKNMVGESFEKTEEARRGLAPLVKEVSLTAQTSTSATLISGNSYKYELPQEAWLIVYEQAVLSGISEPAMVLPVTHDDYYKLSKNPFKQPSKYKVFRLDIHNNICEIISIFAVESYFIRYIVKPPPIVLVGLDNSSVNGVTVECRCSLNPIVHRDILKLAVQKALERYSMNVKEQ